MRLIRKGAEPPLLLAHRKTPGARYKDLPPEAKTELRAALVREQHGLCCFCMQRVEPRVAPELKVKIAHWSPQTVDPARELDWGNLLAACPGNEGAPRDRQSCDTRQGNDVLRVSPCEETHVATFSYTVSGEIRTTRDDLRDDIENRLNLNDVTLRKNREEALRKMLRTIKRDRKGAFTDGALRKTLEICSAQDARGDLQPFAGALEWWLRRRLGPGA
jgi:uncharacterized protein (TIGR02646 family)